MRLKRMVHRLMSTLKLQASHGINFVCSECGALLYHTGRDGAFEGGEVGFPSRQPYEVVESLISCPDCGHKLNPSPDPHSVKIVGMSGSY